MARDYHVAIIASGPASSLFNRPKDWEPERRICNVTDSRYWEKAASRLELSATSEGAGEVDPMVKADRGSERKKATLKDKRVGRVGW
jgi:hypothetical protein